jgi:hypothetical protein
MKNMFRTLTFLYLFLSLQKESHYGVVGLSGLKLTTIWLSPSGKLVLKL